MKKLALHLLPLLLGAISVSQLTANVALGQISVGLPVLSGQPDSTKLGAITVSDLTDSNVTAFQFKIYYNKNVVYLTGVENIGTLTAGNNPTINADTADGFLSVAWASATPLTGSGTLLKVVVQFRNSGTTTLTTSGTSGQTFLFNAGSPRATVTDGSATTSQTSTSIDVTLPNVSGKSGSTADVPVTVGNLTGSDVTAFQFDVYYNKSVAYLTGVDAAASLVGSIAPTVNADTTDGILAVAWASSSPLSGSGTLLSLKIQFRNAGSTTLSTSGPSGQTFIFNAGNPAAVVQNGAVATTQQPATQREISTVKLGDSLVTAQDSSGNVLWQYIAPSNALCSDIADVYGNGHKEVLIGTDQNSFGLVIMLDSTGQEVWQFQTGATGVYWPDSTFNVHVIQVSDLDGNGQNEIVAWSQQSPWYPQRLCVLSPSGSLIADYWNPGYGQMTDNTLVISDLNNDGVKEIIAGSYNNDLGGLNVLFLLEGNKINGQAPPYDGNAPQGTQVWYNDSIPAPVQSIQVVGDLNGDGWNDLSIQLANDSSIYVSGKTGQVITSTLSDGLVAYYPFDGNANDESGNGINGFVSNATLTGDRFGSPNLAYEFNGTDAQITASDPKGLLDFDVKSNEYSVSAWVNFAVTPTNFEEIVIYRGSGLSPFPFQLAYSPVIKAIYVTAYDGNSYVFVPSTTDPVPGSWYMVTATYDTKEVKLYINGARQKGAPYDTYSNDSIPDNFGGTTNSDHLLSIGNDQHAAGYFDGTIDGIRIYNRTLTQTEIADLYHLDGWATGITRDGPNSPAVFRLYQNYPNPFNPSTVISYDLPKPAQVTITVYNVLGERVTGLVDQNEIAGTYSVTFDGSNLPSGVYFYRLEAGEFSSVRKLLLLK